jgi:hypothetical protein
LNAVKARVKLRGLAAIDMRTVAAREMVAFRDDLVSALGGESELSPQRRKLVDLAARTTLYLDHIDGWLAAQHSLINQRTRSVLPVLVQRQGLADHLARLLDKLGLDRVPRRVKSLGDYLAEKYAEAPANGPTPQVPAGEGGGGDVPSGPVIGEEEGGSSPTVDVRVGDTHASGRQNPDGSHTEPGRNMDEPPHCTRCSDVVTDRGRECDSPYGDLGIGTPDTAPADSDVAAGSSKDVTHSEGPFPLRWNEGRE